VNASAIFDYEAVPKEHVQLCNLCAGALEDTNPKPVSHHDRYGYLVGAWRCSCGLAFLSPRMTAEAYAAFYAGPYRALIAAYSKAHGHHVMKEAGLRAGQRIYAELVAKRLRRFVSPEAKTMLDIGGSTGEVAKVLSVALGLKPTVIDPAAHELPEDIESIAAQAETFEPNGRTWDVVTMCQTVDHLLDIAGTLRKVKALLADGGTFFVDIVDCSGPYQVKIDHPYYLTPSVMERYLRNAGFRIRDIRRAADVRHVQFYCR
jgi:hypothetical protein